MKNLLLYKYVSALQLVSLMSVCFVQAQDARFSEFGKIKEYSEPLSDDMKVKSTGTIILKPGFDSFSKSFKGSLVSELDFPAYESVDSDIINSYNYVISHTPMTEMSVGRADSVIADNNALPDPATVKDINTQISYFDGLGRPIQQVSFQSSSSYKDVITFNKYNDAGQEAVKYLPFTAKTGGAGGAHFVDDPQEAQWQYYQNTLISGLSAESDNSPYSVTVFDGSTLNQVMKQGAPGDTWQPASYTDWERHHYDKLISYGYYSNGSGEFRILGVSENGDLLLNGVYAENKLYITLTTDENGNDTEEVKNSQGQIIAKRSYKNNSWVSTFYVYDNFGLLRYVLSPEAVNDLKTRWDVESSWNMNTALWLSDYAYYYEYDERKRMTKKKLPGAGEVHMFYDKRNRLVATQDGVQRTDNEILYTRYDVLNRPVMTGILTYSSSITDQSVKDHIEEHNILNEYLSENTANHYYETVTFPYAYPENEDISENRVLTVTYYDDYKEPSLSEKYNQCDISEKTDRVKGLVTGVKTRVGEGGDSWSFETFIYDNKYRVIQSYKDTEIPGASLIIASEQITNKYSFTGQVLSTEQKLTFDTIVTKVNTKIDYDHAGRPYQTAMKVNDDTWKVINRMKYDELGNLKAKELGGGEQVVDYKYNIRNWLTHMNDPDNISGDLFAMELGYDDKSINSEYSNAGNYYGKPQFNGNISVIKWSTGDLQRQSYLYSYDQLNRLMGSKYVAESETDDAYNLSGVTYDDNGNIKTLKRATLGESGVEVIDDLEYSYNGNQLTTVSDLSNWDMGFKSNQNAQNTLSIHYTYDDNGNLKKDVNKDIYGILYNYLNLPVSINHKAYNTKYLYSATGVKYKRSKTLMGDMIDSRYYISNFEYNKNMQLEYIHTSEGRIRMSSGTPIYDYYLKDHLGNTRVVFTDNGSGTPEVQQVSNYYPFGMRFGETNQIGNETTDYMYNGKEFQEELGWYDYGFRYYDAALARFTTIDPLTEKNHSQSGFVYAANNPIKYIDYMGLDSIFYNQAGEETHRVEAKGDHTYFMGHDDGNKTINGQTYYQGNSYDSFFGDRTDRGLFTSVDDETLATKQDVLDETNDYIDGQNPELGQGEFLANSSEGGTYDFKNQVLDPAQANEETAMRTAYMHNGVLYNRNEAGNLMWGVASSRVGMTYGGVWFAAQGYTLVTEFSGDEMGESNAIHLGRFYHNRSNGFHKNKNWLGTRTQGDDPTK